MMTFLLLVKTLWLLVNIRKMRLEVLALGGNYQESHEYIVVLTNCY